MSQPLPPSWFERNVRTIVRAVFAICGLLIVADLVFHFVGHKHVHYDWEAIPGFYALVGFVSYVGLVLTAKQLRRVLRRDEDFYGDHVPRSGPPIPHVPGGHVDHASADDAPEMADDGEVDARRRESEESE